MESMKRAPVWEIRCCRCGHTEPFGDVRIGAYSYKKFTVRRCPGCRKIGFHAIEKRRK